MATQRKVVIGKKDLIFTPQEIDDSFISMNKEEAANFLENVNSSIGEWSAKGCLKIKLTDFSVPQEKNAEVEKIKQLRNGDQYNSATISVAVQTIRKFREGIYKAKIEEDNQKLTIEEYNKLVETELFPEKFESGIKFMEHFFSRLRKLKPGESIQVFYPGLTSRVTLKGEEASGFNLEGIKSPLQDVIPRKIPGFNCGCYSYFGILGSCFFLHNDDYESNAVNLVSFGGQKLWILVPKAYKDMLRTLLVNTAPKNPKCFPDHKDLLVDPQFLRSHGIPFSIVTQSPSEILVVARSTYHEGLNFSEGGKFTIASACNALFNDYLLEFEEFKGKIIKSCRCTKVSVSLTKKEQEEMTEKIAKIAEQIREKNGEKRNADNLNLTSEAPTTSKRQRLTGQEFGDSASNI